MGSSDSFELPLSEMWSDEIGELKTYWNLEDPWDYDPKDLVPLQMEALRTRFRERGSQLRVLGQRANDEGINSVDGLQDLVPLLFGNLRYDHSPIWTDGVRTSACRPCCFV